MVLAVEAGRPVIANGVEDGKAQGEIDRFLTLTGHTIVKDRHG